MKQEIDEDFKKNYKNFISEIDKRYYKEKVAISDEEISAYDLINALKNRTGKYNNIFIDRLDKIIKLFNRRNGYTSFTSPYKDKKCRRIGNIGFYVDENGYYYCKLYYCDGKGRLIGTGIVDNTVKVDGNDEEAIKNKKDFLILLDTLATFAEDNPETSYRWDLLNRQVDKFYVGDDFLSCMIDVYHLDYTAPNFTHSYEVDKYATFDKDLANKIITQCGNDFLKRMSVKLNGLDSKVKEIVKKEYNLNGDKLVK